MPVAARPPILLDRTGMDGFLRFQFWLLFNENALGLGHLLLPLHLLRFRLYLTLFTTPLGAYRCFFLPLRPPNTSLIVKTKQNNSNKLSAVGCLSESDVDFVMPADGVVIDGNIWCVYSLYFCGWNGTTIFHYMIYGFVGLGTREGER